MTCTPSRAAGPDAGPSGRTPWAGRPARPRLGAISFLHRFGSALNHHVHLHACATDGVFEPAADEAGCDGPPLCVSARPITPAAAASPPGREPMASSNSRCLSAGCRSGGPAKPRLWLRPPEAAGAMDGLAAVKQARGLRAEPPARHPQPLTAAGRRVTTKPRGRRTRRDSAPTREKPHFSGTVGVSGEPFWDSGERGTRLTNRSPAGKRLRRRRWPDSTYGPGRVRGLVRRARGAGLSGLDRAGAGRAAGGGGRTGRRDRLPAGDGGQGRGHFTRLSAARRLRQSVRCAPSLPPDRLDDFRLLRILPTRSSG